MNRTSEARHLQATLSAETGVVVEIVWDRSALSPGWRWHVLWPDGPTERAMRAHVERITALRSAALTAGDLVYLRTVRTGSLALTMVRNVRLGQPPSAAMAASGNSRTSCTEPNTPSRASLRISAEPQSWRSSPTMTHPAMTALLLRIGLAGLDETAPAESNVISLDGWRAAQRKR